MHKINFIEVDKNSKKHTNFLYDLLSKRNFPISHESNPTIDDHKKFIKNHPYRYWFLALVNNEFIGSLYICFDNVVGINLIEEKHQYYIKIINYVLKNFQPLDPIKSIRNKNFLININPKNNEFKKALNQLNMKHIQNTFLVE